MRFGGHETFVVREGWLHKGLSLMIEDARRLTGPFAQDELGVGKNMAKSIRHWLVATGLAERTGTATTREQPTLKPTALGRLVAERDPYFLLPGTWWMLHVNLVNSPGDAYTWWWFFNHFRRPRFERPVCQEGLVRFVDMHERRRPGRRTLQRDVSCLLAMYARTYPPAQADPEDGNQSPFIELGLLSHFRESGTFRRNTPRSESLPAELLGYALSRCSNTSDDPASYSDFTFRQCASVPGGPGSALGLNAEQLYGYALSTAAALGDELLAVISLAGDRRVRFRTIAAVEWADLYYGRVQKTELAA